MNFINFLLRSARECNSSIVAEAAPKSGEKRKTLDDDEFEVSQTARRSKALPREMAEAMHGYLVEGLSLKKAVARQNTMELKERTLRRRVKAFLNLRGVCDRKHIDPNTISLHALEEFVSQNTLGRPCHLTPFQEMVFAHYISSLSLLGHALTRLDLIEEAGLFMKSLGLELKSNLTDGWLTTFLTRHPELVSRDGRVLDPSREIGASRVPLWFKEYGVRLPTDSRLIGNIDECGIFNAPGHLKVICSSMKKVATFAGVETEIPHVSLMPLIVASGEILHSLLMVANESLRLDVPEHSMLFAKKMVCAVATPNGFITQEVLFRWMSQDAIPAINAHRLQHGLKDESFYLLLDGHKSHVSVELVALASSAKIILVYFPAHSSHIIQPLDRGFFHSLKTNICHKNQRISSYLNKLTLHQRLINILDALLEMEANCSVITKSFKHAGIFPLDAERATSITKTAEHGFTDVINLDVCAHVTDDVKSILQSKHLGRICEAESQSNSEENLLTEIYLVKTQEFKNGTRQDIYLAQRRLPDKYYELLNVLISSRSKTADNLREHSESIRSLTSHGGMSSDPDFRDKCFAQFLESAFKKLNRQQVDDFFMQTEYSGVLAAPEGCRKKLSKEKIWQNVIKFVPLENYDSLTIKMKEFIDKN